MSSRICFTWSSGELSYLGYSFRLWIRLSKRVRLSTCCVMAWTRSDRSTCTLGSTYVFGTFGSSTRMTLSEV